MAFISFAFSPGPCLCIYNSGIWSKALEKTSEEANVRRDGAATKGTGVDQTREEHARIMWAVWERRADRPLDAKPENLNFLTLRH